MEMEDGLVEPRPCKRVKVVSAVNADSQHDGLRIDQGEGSVTITIDPIAAVARKTLHSDNDHPQKEKDCDRGSLSDFNTDILCRITSFLDPSNLLLGLGLTNHFFHDLCQQNCAGWDFLCEQTWQHKCHVALQARTEPNKLQAYRMALQDAQNRYWITEDELCYDGNANTDHNQNIQPTIWSFRFKESAGTDWTASDPWYQGQPCRKMAFFRNGTVREVLIQHPQSTSPESTTSHPHTLANGDTIHFADPPLRMTWRFLTRPMDLPHRPRGSYVRFTVGGRDVPTYAVRRSPTGNWGFVMESCWGVYASFELPPRKPHVLRRRGRLPGAVWVPDDEEVAGAPLSSRAADMQDDTLRLTNEIQWREAFLYNVGARVLPEGDQAADEFDRAWQA